MTPEESLKENFKSFGFPDEASNWLIELWRFSQTWDDLFDGDSVSDGDLFHCLFLSQYGLHMHAFYQQNAKLLAPVLLNAIFKWRASDVLEKSGDVEELPKCYMWRAAFYDVVLQVMIICKGPEFARDNAHLCLKLYGEKLSDLEAEHG